MAGILVTVGFCWICTTCQNRGADIVFLKGAINRLDSLVSRKNDTIAIERNRVYWLQKDTARLGRQLADKRVETLQLQAQLTAGEKAALLVDQAITQGKAKVNNLVNSMDALQKKLAADAGLAAEGLGFTSPVDQEQINDRIAKLTGYGQVYADSTQALKELTGQQRERIDQQTETIAQQEGRIAELSADLFGARYQVQEDFISSQKEKHPFGFGQKKSKERLRQTVLSRLPKTAN